jgi:microcystin degradation protein MlrC
MRIYIGGLYQETNTFSPARTDLAVFQRGRLLEGEGLRRAAPLDGVLLTLHGAAVSEGREDCDGALLSAVREEAGAGVPVAATLDPHAWVTEAMLGAADLLSDYRTYPHMDFAETGSRAARDLIQLLPAAGEGGSAGRPLALFRKLRMIVPVDNAETRDGPLALLYRDSMEASRIDGFPAADLLDAELRRIWARRSEFLLEFPGVERFLAERERYERPTIVIDSDDITSAGGVGDSTVILRAFLGATDRPKTVLAVIDPLAVARAFSVG